MGQTRKASHGIYQPNVQDTTSVQEPQSRGPYLSKSKPDESIYIHIKGGALQQGETTIAVEVFQDIG